MRIVLTSLTMVFLLTAALAEEKKEEPADEKARARISKVTISPAMPDAAKIMATITN